MKDYPNQEELTKLINLCWNAVGNSAAGPMKKSFIQQFGQMKILSLEEIENLKKQGKEGDIHVLNDGTCINLVQILVAQMCPKSPAIYKNLDDKGF